MGGLNPAQALSLYSNANPFAGAGAFANSNYSLYHDGTLVRLLDWREPAARAKLAHHALRTFVLSERFSCAGAKAAVQTGSYRFGYYRRMTDDAAIEGLARDLCAYVAELPHLSGRYKSFVAVFGDTVRGELHFERLLWEMLERLRVLDAPFHSWDPSVSSDPRDPNFAFSFAGAALFAVGLHPQSSRISRRFGHAAVAFNSHAAFRTLREDGSFERVRRAVRRNEIALQGNLNPNLADFGEQSEARQYSGREVDGAWRCPFHHR